MMKAASFAMIVKALNDAGVRYLVVGGVAVIAHGYVRLTVDVDLMIQLEPDNLVKGLQALEQLGYKSATPVSWEDFANPIKRREWIEQKQMKVLKLFSDTHRDTTIDVFVDDPLGFDDAYLRLKKFPVAENLDAPVCSYPDLIKLKLEAGREKDVKDLATLRQIRGEK
jgi:hypothetical protein